METTFDSNVQTDETQNQFDTVEDEAFSGNELVPLLKPTTTPDPKPPTNPDDPYLAKYVKQARKEVSRRALDPLMRALQDTSEPKKLKEDIKLLSKRASSAEIGSLLDSEEMKKTLIKTAGMPAVKRLTKELKRFASARSDEDTEAPFQMDGEPHTLIIKEIDDGVEVVMCSTPGDLIEKAEKQIQFQRERTDSPPGLLEDLADILSQARALQDSGTSDQQATNSLSIALMKLGARYELGDLGLSAILTTKNTGSRTRLHQLNEAGDLDANPLSTKVEKDNGDGSSAAVTILFPPITEQKGSDTFVYVYYTAKDTYGYLKTSRLDEETRETVLALGGPGQIQDAHINQLFGEQLRNTKAEIRKHLVTKATKRFAKAVKKDPALQEQFQLLKELFEEQTRKATEGTLSKEELVSHRQLEAYIAQNGTLEEALMRSVGGEEIADTVLNHAQTTIDNTLRAALQTEKPQKTLSSVTKQEIKHLSRRISTELDGRLADVRANRMTDAVFIGIGDPELMPVEDEATNGQELEITDVVHASSIEEATLALTSLLGSVASKPGDRASAKMLLNIPIPLGPTPIVLYVGVSVDCQVRRGVKGGLSTEPNDFSDPNWFEFSGSFAPSFDLGIAGVPGSIGVSKGAFLRCGAQNEAMVATLLASGLDFLILDFEQPIIDSFKNPELSINKQPEPLYPAGKDENEEWFVELSPSSELNIGRGPTEDILSVNSVATIGKNGANQPTSLNNSLNLNISFGGISTTCSFSADGYEFSFQINNDSTDGTLFEKVKNIAILSKQFAIEGIQSIDALRASKKLSTVTKLFDSLWAQDLLSKIPIHDSEIAKFIPIPTKTQTDSNNLLMSHVTVQVIKSEKPTLQIEVFSQEKTAVCVSDSMFEINSSEMLFYLYA